MGNLFDGNYKKETIEGFKVLMSDKKEEINRIQAVAIEARRKIGNVWAAKDFYETMGLTKPNQYTSEKAKAAIEFNNIQDANIRIIDDCRNSIAKLKNEIEVLEGIIKEY